METKEAILATIDELNSEDFSDESSANQNALDSRDLRSDMQMTRDFRQNPSDSQAPKDTQDSQKLKDLQDLKNAQDSGDSKPNLFIDIKEEADLADTSEISDEISLLLRLKEKSLVLFEGLRGAQNNDDTKIKLEMVISYLEYQLYLIEDRLNALKSR